MKRFPKLVLYSGCLLALGLAAFWQISRVPQPRRDIPAGSAPSAPTQTKAETSPEPTSPDQFGVDWAGSVQNPVAAEATPAPSLLQWPENEDAAREWARTNPSAALQWALSAPPSPWREAVVEMLCSLQAETDPARAVDLADRFAEAKRSLPSLVQRWAEEDDAAAHAYAANKPPGEEHDQLIGRIAFARSKNDPASAANLAVAEIAPGEIQEEAVMSVLHQWALKDLKAATAWAELFPPGNFRARALKEMENIAELKTQQTSASTATHP